MSARYSWTRAYAVPPQVVGEFYYSLPDRSPERFLEASRKRSAPTHELFEWNESKAAAEYRLVQARTIIACLQVEIVNTAGESQHVRAFIGSSERGRHTATLEASQEELTAEEQRCLNEMNAFKKKWRTLQLAREVILAMQATEASAVRRPRGRPRRSSRRSGERPAA